MTQAELAERSGIPLTTLQTIEDGKSWPEFSNLMAICDTLGIHPSTLFIDPENRPKPTPEEALAVLSEHVHNQMKAKAPIPLRYIERLEKLSQKHLALLFETAVAGMEEEESELGKDPEKDL